MSEDALKDALKDVPKDVLSDAPKVTSALKVERAAPTLQADLQVDSPPDASGQWCSPTRGAGAKVSSSHSVT